MMELEKVFAVLGCLSLINAVLRFLARDYAYRRKVLLRPADRIMMFLKYAQASYPRGMNALEVAHTCFLSLGEASVLLAELAEDDKLVCEWDGYAQRAYYRLVQK